MIMILACGMMRCDYLGGKVFVYLRAASLRSPMKLRISMINHTPSTGKFSAAKAAGAAHFIRSAAKAPAEKQADQGDDKFARVCLVRRPSVPHVLEGRHTPPMRPDRSPDSRSVMLASH